MFLISNYGNFHQKIKYDFISNDRISNHFGNIVSYEVRTETVRFL